MHGDACFAYFNKNWDIPSVRATCDCNLSCEMSVRALARHAWTLAPARRARIVTKSTNSRLRWPRSARTGPSYVRRWPRRGRVALASTRRPATPTSRRFSLGSWARSGAGLMSRLEKGGRVSASPGQLAPSGFLLTSFGTCLRAGVLPPLRRGNRSPWNKCHFEGQLDAVTRPRISSGCAPSSKSRRRSSQACAFASPDQGLVACERINIPERNS